MSLELQASQRQYADVNEQLGQSQKRALNLSHELEDMKNNLEKVILSFHSILFPFFN